MHNCTKFDQCRICVTDLREEGGEGGVILASPIREQPRKDPSLIGLKAKEYFKTIEFQDDILRISGGLSGVVMLLFVLFYFVFFW